MLHVCLHWTSNYLLTWRLLLVCILKCAEKLLLHTTFFLSSWKNVFYWLTVYFMGLAFIVKSPLLWLKCYLIWCSSHRAAAYQRQFDILVILSRLMEKTKAIQFQWDRRCENPPGMRGAGKVNLYQAQQNMGTEEWTALRGQHGDL